LSEVFGKYGHCSSSTVQAAGAQNGLLVQSNSSSVLVLPEELVPTLLCLCSLQKQSSRGWILSPAPRCLPPGRRVRFTATVSRFWYGHFNRTTATFDAITHALIRRAHSDFHAIRSKRNQKLTTARQLSCGADYLRGRSHGSLLGANPKIYR